MTGLRTGVIRKALSGFYYVRSDKNEYVCRGRGILRRRGISPLVGDEVTIAIQDDEEGVIDEIGLRRNAFVRPPVANIDIFVCVVAATNPEPNPEVLDRFLVTAESAKVPAVICVNKSDLNGEMQERIRDIYGKIYPVVCTSVVTGEGLEELKSHISGKTVAFAGPSGVGKSSLIGSLTGAPADIGGISRKTGRGKHTTRHVEIYDTDFGAEIFDTPGYTSFDGSFVPDAELDAKFPEIAEAAENCRFDDCRHDGEPDCAVKDAAAAGRISASRYESFLRISKEMREREKK